MSKFVFKYSSVQKIKENFERKAQKELAQIDLFIQQQEKLKKDLIDEINLLRNNKNIKRVYAADLIFAGGYKNSVIKKIESVDSELNNLNNKRNQKLDEVLQKSKEKKVLNKLEEIHIENFVKESNQIETKELDEIAVQKFTRDKK